MINDIAPARRVAVDMPLPEKADLDSVELGEFGFGIGTDAVTYRPDAGAQTFNDERPFHVVVAPRFEGDETELDLSLRAQAWLDRDPENPAVHWLLSLLDPETGVAHANPDAGFLPPEPAEEDNEGAGQGFTNVAFRLSSEMATGDVVTASAGIVFDDNPEIMTEPSSNRLDRTAPPTSIDGSTQIPVGGYATIVPTDTGSGPGLVDVWRSVDGGPLVLWRYQVAPGSVAPIDMERRGSSRKCSAQLMVW